MSCETNGTCGCGAAGTTTLNETQGETRRVAAFRPEVDIYETGDEYVVTADVPGAKPETIDLNVENGVLTLRAGVAERGPEGARPVAREYGVGAYERSFRIGEGIDAARIGAELRHGVLTLRLPKAETTRSRKVTVQTKG